MKLEPFPTSLLNPDAPAVQLDQALGQGEAEAGALGALAVGVARLLELLEDALAGRRRQSRGRCRRRKRRPRRCRWWRRRPHWPPCGVNLTAFESRLNTTWRIRRSSPCTRSTAGSSTSSSCTPFFSARSLTITTPRSSASRSEKRPALELQLACLHLGQVEDVVDQGEQVVGGGEDVFEVLGLLLVDFPEQLLLQHLGEDRRSRSAACAARGSCSPGSRTCACDATSSACVRSATLALQAADQVLHALGHLVEGRGERAQLVLAIQLDPLVVGARADRLRRHLQALDRTHQPAREQDGERDRGQRRKRRSEGRCFQIFPRRGAKAADSGCSTNTFQPVEGTTAHAREDLAVARDSRRSPTRRANPSPAPASTCGSFRWSGRIDVCPPPVSALASPGAAG